MSPTAWSPSRETSPYARDSRRTSGAPRSDLPQLRRRSLWRGRSSRGVREKPRRNRTEEPTNYSAIEGGEDGTETKEDRTPFRCRWSSTRRASLYFPPSGRSPDMRSGSRSRRSWVRTLRGFRSAMDRSPDTNDRTRHCQTTSHTTPPTL